MTWTRVSGSLGFFPHLPTQDHPYIMVRNPIASCESGLCQNGGLSPHGSYLFPSQSRVRVQFSWQPWQPWHKTVFPCMSHVFRMGQPFQVFHSVISMIGIHVIRFLSSYGQATKGTKYETGWGSEFRSVVLPESNFVPSVSVDILGQQFGGPPNPATGRYFIPLEFWDWLPLLSAHGSQYSIQVRD